MIFTSFEFIIFFLVVLLVRAFLTNFKAEKWFLLVASYFFYMSWSVPCVTLLLFTSLMDYHIGRLLWRTENLRRRKILLSVSLVLNLGVLGFFKYANFLLDTAWHGLSLFGAKMDPVHLNILLPVGISFFTFQSMSYTIDIYRRQMTPCSNARDFLLFVAFFPQLVAGPIVRAADFLPQLASRLRAKAEDIEAGLALFALGAVKKVVLSDQVAGHVDVIFANPANFDALTLLQGLIGYAIQIYCDFSGYSDMAIGCARIMGYRFPDNFQMPYSAVNITEFWRRWHISLSTWLRDYLYIPLGGNRLGVGRTYINLLITMLLGGLWHGASWNFVIWGGIHGLALVLHKYWQSRSKMIAMIEKWIPALVRLFFSYILTLSIVLLGWIFFRAQTFSAALEMLWNIASWNMTGTRLLSPHILAAFAAISLIHLTISKKRNWAEEIPFAPVGVRIIAYTSLLTILACLGATDAAPFIYFQF